MRNIVYEDHSMPHGADDNILDIEYHNNNDDYDDINRDDDDDDYNSGGTPTTLSRLHFVTHLS